MYKYLKRLLSPTIGKRDKGVIFFHKFIVINGLCSRIDTR